MPLGRFFGRGRDDKPGSPAQEQEEEVIEETVEEIEIDVGDDIAPEAAPDTQWRERAEKWIPNGASTGSKRADKLYGEAHPDLPTHFTMARGAFLTDMHGAEYLDCGMALGSVALGYAEPRVTAAVIEAAQRGNVSALSTWREVELAERLCTMIPCAERVQFLKTGAEAVAAAVRLARVYTGREQVIACGYFGWHDWCSDAAGVPLAVRRTVDWVPFDEIGALDLAVTAAGTSLAAIVIEPVIEQAPSAEWLQKARELCDKHGAVLIFDEVKTGFRVATGGYQEVCGVTPDLAAFGKAMANGYPLSAVAGREALMKVSSETWISSTLASEATALAAALAVVEWHEEADICATLAETGREMRAAVDRAIAASGISGVTTHGIDPMWFMKWDDETMEHRFLAEAARNGVLFKRGAYNYAAIAHDEQAIADIEAAASAALVSLRELS
jgi:glutamate-1-semialdehyde 2,1-aminomutase